MSIGIFDCYEDHTAVWERTWDLMRSVSAGRQHMRQTICVKPVAAVGDPCCSLIHKWSSQFWGHETLPELDNMRYGLTLCGISLHNEQSGRTGGGAMLPR
jgi:hypothetical protein